MSAATAASALPSDDNGAMRRVLLAEDDGTSRLITAAYLDRLGYEVTAVNDGPAAVAAAAAARYDIVLMDLLLPGLDGLEAAAAIRAAASDRHQPTIVVMTGTPAALDPEAAARLGIEVVLAKPVTRDTLGRALGAAAGSGLNLGHDDFSLDAHEIDALHRSLGEEFDEIIGVFLAEAEARLARIAPLTSAEEREAMRREAHSLKSAAATFGCHALATAAQALEDGAATLDGATLAARKTALSRAFAAVKTGLSRNPS